MSWNTLKVDDSEYNSIILYDGGGNHLKDMLTQNSYSFTCPANEAQHFQIICRGETSNGKIDTNKIPLLYLVLIIVLIIICLLILYWKIIRR